MKQNKNAKIFLRKRGQIENVLFFYTLNNHKIEILFFFSYLGKVGGRILNDRASHSRYFSDELDAQFFC